MSVPKIMALRMGIYCVLVGYLVCDLFFFRGPIKKALTEPALDREAAIAEAKASGVAARVYYRPIFRAQVEEAMKEYLWRRGRTLDETSAPERKMLRELVVNDLIDDELIKLQIKLDESGSYEISEEEIAKGVEIENRRYPSPEVFDELAKTGRWEGVKEQRLRVAARIQRAGYFRKAFTSEVTEEEARQWFDAHEESLGGASFEESRESIVNALELKKRDSGWQWFRLNRLRFRAEGKVDIFEDVLYAEEGE